MITFRRAGVSALLIAAFALVGLSFASPAEATHAWGGYHWARTDNPFTIKLGDNVGLAWDSTLATASGDWSFSGVLDTSVVAGGTSAQKGRNTPKNCIPTAGRDEICNAAYGATGWLGIAQIWVSGGVHITQGTVKLNDTYFSTVLYNTPAWRALVACQEIGHTFGLDHQDEHFDNPNLGTCMDYTNDPSTNQHPNAHDYEELDIIYAHLDTFTTISSSLPSKHGASALAQSADFTNASEWGRSTGKDAKGRDNQFERDLDSGVKLITHVFWVN